MNDKTNKQKTKPQKTPNPNVLKYCCNLDYFLFNIFQITYAALRFTWCMTSQYIIYKTGKQISFFKKSIILLSLMGSRFEIYQNLMNNHHQEVQEWKGRPVQHQLCQQHNCCNFNTETMVPSVLSATFRKSVAKSFWPTCQGRSGYSCVHRKHDKILNDHEDSSVV